LKSDLSALDELFTFDIDVVPGVVLTNFHPPEAGFVWSSHKWSEIKFDINPDALSDSGGSRHTALDVALDMDVFKAQPELEGQNVLLYVNGLRLGSRYIKGRITVMLVIPLHLVRSKGNVITIDTPDATKPTEFGLGDTRVLGIQLFSIRTTVA